MQVFEIKQAIGKYKEGDEINLYANDIRVTGLLIDYNDDDLKIKSENGEIITLLYSDITDI